MRRYKVTNDVVDNYNKWVDEVNEGRYGLSCFPNDDIAEYYISTVHVRSEKEIKNTLRFLLVKSGGKHLDISDYEIYKLYKEGKAYNKEPDRGRYEKLISSEHYQRKIRTEGRLAWEGITWILDLLPVYPYRALGVLYSYFLANYYALYDDYIDGIMDAAAIIRAKFCSADTPKEVLLNLSAEEFELLVTALYNKMGYCADWVGRDKSQGVDVLVSSNKDRKAEIILVECKRYSEEHVGLKYAERLLSKVDARSAKKGIIVTTNYFTNSVEELAMSNPKIELVNINKLSELLDEYLGIDWIQMIDYYIIGSISAQ